MGIDSGSSASTYGDGDTVISEDMSSQRPAGIQDKGVSGGLTRGEIGLLLHQRGDLCRAEDAYRSALEDDAGDSESSFLLGLLLFQQQRYDEAVELLLDAVADNPENPDRYDMLGEAYKAVGRFENAAGAFARALEIRPDHESARIHLGYVRLKQKRYKDSATLFNDALHANPKDVSACLGLACTCSETFQHEMALRLYSFARDLDHSSYVPLYGMGQAYAGLGKFGEAEKYLRKALELSPENSSLESNLGAVLKEQGKKAEAFLAYQAALAHNPQNATAAFGLGGWYWLDQDYGEAKRWHERAIALEPDAASAHANLAMILLMEGDFRRGWEEYEWRFKISDPAQSVDNRTFHKPLWDGSPFPGRTLLIQSEQGAGDMIQFCRYMPMVKALGGSVVLECAPRLTRLLQDLPGVDQLVPRMEAPPVPFDLYLPLLSSPKFFSDSIDKIPAQIPYLFPEQPLIEATRHRIPGAGLKVGLCWQGNRTYKHDASRSIPLQELFPLFDISGITFFSLQKGEGSEDLQLLPSKYEVLDLGACLDNGGDAFVETAAAMYHLDLVISSDTAIPHLAGALGIPVWVILAHTPEWRWMFDRDDSPWYPTMKLFRQRAPGDWKGVIKSVGDKLCSLTQREPRQ